MSVASQLRLAIGVLILLLAGILAVALYVPAQIYESANEKYVDDPIPLGNHVHQLTEGVLVIIDKNTSDEVCIGQLHAPRLG